MKVTLVLVSSVDGFITDGKSASIYEWTSKEDSQHFFSLIKRHHTIIMGRKTYQDNKDVIRLESGKLRIVMTSNPEQFVEHTVTGQLEFTNEQPQQILSRLSVSRPEDILLVGGSEVATAFLEANLVDSFLITLEPILFGGGKHMFNHFPMQINMQLINVEQLNQKGTLMLEYQPVK